MVMRLIVAMGVMLSSAAQAIDVTPFVKQPLYAGVFLSPSGDYLAMTVKAEDKDYPYKYALKVLEWKSRKVLYEMGFPGKLSVNDVIWANNERMILTAAHKVGGREQLYSDPNVVSVNVDGSRQQTIFGPRAGSWGSSSSAAAANKAKADYAFLDVLRRDSMNPERVFVAKYPWHRTWNDEVKPYTTYLNVYNGQQSDSDKIDLPDADGLVIDHNNVVRFAHLQDVSLKEHVYYRKSGEADWELMWSAADGAPGGWLPVSFSNDNTKVLILDREDGPQYGLSWYDVETRRREPIFRSTRVDVSRGDLYWTADKRQVFAFKTEDGTPQVRLIDSKVPEAELLRMTASGFPGKRIEPTSYSENGQLAVFEISGDTTPPFFVMVDASTRKITKLVDTMPWLKDVPLAATKAVDIAARDDVILPSYLTLPTGKNGKDLPAVVLVHGGPYGIRDAWGFDSDVQTLAAAGYAVLQVNYRGSGGYGEQHQYSGFGEYGAAMQDDLTDATKWLIAQGIADAGRVCIMGHSYGGYAAIWGAVREPDLYRCAIGSMGVYDLQLKYEEGNCQKNEACVHFMQSSIGNDPATLAARSPVNHVAKIKAALMLSHGEEDRQVPIEHAERLKAALKAAKKPFDWFEFGGEAHGFASEENRKRFQTAVLAFLDKHIGH